MKKMVRALLLCLFVGCAPLDNFIYWENLSEDAQREIVDKNTFNTQISEVKIKSNNHVNVDDLMNMMGRMTAPDIKEEFLPFYFHMFNSWCQQSDGEISEIMGPYCISMLLNYPDYVLNYFQSHLDIMESYALYIGYELAWQDENNRDDPASQKFFATLKSHTQDFRRYRKIYDSFCDATQTWMNRSAN